MTGLHIETLFFIVFFYSRIHGIFSLTHHGDVVVLQALKNSWQNTPPSWNLSNDPCDSWEGVACSNSRVTQLTLSGARAKPTDAVSGDLTEQKSLRFSPRTTTGLRGKLDGVIGDLTELKKLFLSDNKYLTGALPPQLGNLSNLNQLYLIDCSFTGNIPDELGNLTQLSQLDLSGNKLSGKIPPSLGKLSALTWFDLSQNQLSGKIPVSTGKTPGLDLLRRVECLDLSFNKYLTGALPPLLGNLSSLSQLVLVDCSFTGSIPHELGNLTGLLGLELSANSLNGKIPTFLGSLSALRWLDLSENQLSGQLPVSTGKTLGLDRLLNLESLVLSQNRLSGVLPDLSKMFSLKILGLSNNSFDAAEAPSWFSTLPSLIFLDMEYGSLEGPIPTKLFSLSSLRRVKLRNNAFNGTLTINQSSNTSHQLELVDLQNNQISSITFDSYSTTLMLAGNPLCAKVRPYTSYCY